MDTFKSQLLVGSDACEMRVLCYSMLSSSHEMMTTGPTSLTWASALCSPLALIKRSLGMTACDQKGVSPLT